MDYKVEFKVEGIKAIQEFITKQRQMGWKLIAVDDKYYYFECMNRY